MTETLNAYVVFIDRDARKGFDEDAIVTTSEACKKHMRELRKMGFENATFAFYANESEYYAAKERFESK